ncbi:hypothetical protein CONLIGDRAFT_685671 [Coniochaeta ligniaria NRRL 30616]|uniref:Uncharacterized protein n=1 Tax=Coniochaeta ligniaria NRRL 30616 TaxID=1408157 RepID=A0A1J7IBN8_9PEZI|nr:hypothetical protein CONLIGDRAFT_685671 [Coniochaeta ligniaria NRRL 30616]
MVYPLSQKASIQILYITSLLLSSNALPQLPGGASVQEDTSQVSINERPDANSAVTNLPITVTIFSDSPGPKICRGSPAASLTLPRPDGLGLRTGSQCYNLPSVAGCGNFVANKDDGCEARLFEEPACVSYVNTAVFMPENRAVGGMWRSFSVECGIPAPDPASLGAPPLQGMMQDIKRPHQG